MVHGLADIGAESVLLAGAGRAILLQIANPEVGRGVAAHSNFAERPLDRLVNTLGYVYAVVYGTEEQLATVRRSVNRAHAPVRRRADAGSPGYSAFDPQSQLWVVATLYDTAVTIHEAVHGPLSEAAADRVYRDYARIGTTLQLPPDLWPQDRAAFHDYWDSAVQQLRPGADAVRVAHQLLHPRSAGAWLRLVMPLARFLTAGFLPAALREQFGLRWSARHQRRFDRTLRFLSVVYPRLPQGIRHWPKNYCLDRVKPAQVRQAHA
ncbi:oxygenase MpaB family protein [Arthrobacter sp. M4]|uniref:oxygenase MpaB family protein n=1 Tax=Arthrobacter sp. M4 TaxID=218160 RepID=UPI001CDBCF20|nr:oxygenase MpaB family protein [Arthrobacter sp. M4]MCA4135446.1 DUF2236 domain-containing protein [Arthrobacter sp. M4]